MSRTDFLATIDPDRLAKIFRDSEAAGAAIRPTVPHAALARLPALHREAGRDLHLWRFLASSPQFCLALMLEGAVTLAAGSEVL
ncbi:MAG TPA: hypothetical protein VN175_01555, partial [Rhizomicrobium sp.]|nr:hypothetical protein [Rhizomicrobium sp.]